MIFADAINYAHDLVIECGKLDLPHKMVAHNAIDRIEASYNSDINKLVDENARLKEELRDVMGSNARLKTALRAMMDIAASNTDYCHNNQSSRKPIDWDVPYHALSNIWERGREALAAEGGAK